MLCADLNWLPTSLFKGLPYPTVEYKEEIGQNYGGYYTFSTGVITVVYDEPDTLASTIAHEFKHYLQDLNNTSYATNFSINGTYENSINNYFLSYPTEMEALLFEFQHAKSYLNEWWLRKLVLNK